MFHGSCICNAVFYEKYSPLFNIEILSSCKIIPDLCYIVEVLGINGLGACLQALAGGCTMTLYKFP